MGFQSFADLDSVSWFWVLIRSVILTCPKCGQPMSNLPPMLRYGWMMPAVCEDFASGVQILGFNLFVPGGVCVMTARLRRPSMHLAYGVIN